MPADIKYLIDDEKKLRDSGLPAAKDIAEALDLSASDAWTTASLRRLIGAQRALEDLKSKGMLAKRYVQELSKTMTDADKIQWVEENIPRLFSDDVSPEQRLYQESNALNNFDKLIENKSLSELRYAQEMEGVYGVNNKRSDLLRKAEAGIQKEYLEKLQEAGLPEDIDDYLESTIQRNRPMLEVIEGERGKPPPAPFVTKTEGWNKLAVKRIMNKAAKEDYDMVAFPSGDIQFDRWRNEGLKQQYDEILPGIIKTVAGKKPNLRIEVGEGSELYEVPAIRLDDKVGKQTIRERSLSPQTMFSAGAGITALGGATLLTPEQAQAQILNGSSFNLANPVKPKKESPGVASLSWPARVGRYERNWRRDTWRGSGSWRVPERV